MNLGLLDSDPAFLRGLQTAIRQNLRDTQILTGGSLQDLLPLVEETVKGKEGTEESGPSQPGAAKDSGDFDRQLEILADNQVGEVMDVLTPPGSAFLGFPNSRHFQDKVFWKTLVDIDERRRFNEFVNLTRRSSSGSDVFVVRDAMKNAWRTKVSFQVMKDGVSRFSFDAFEPVVEKGQSREKGFKEGALDLLIVDWSLIQIQPRKTLSEIHDQLAPFQRRVDKGSPPTIISVPGGADVSIDELLALPILDVIIKPFDDLLFLQKLNIFVPAAQRQSREDFLYTSSKPFWVEMGLEVPGKGIAETGLRIRSKMPFKGRTRLKMYSDLFGPPGRDGLYGYGVWQGALNGEPTGLLTLVGLRPDQLLHLRSRVGENRDFGTKTEVAVSKKTQIHGLRLNEEEQLKNQLVVIDLDPETRKLADDLVERHLENMELISCDSLKSFLQRIETSEQTESPFADKDWEFRPAFFPNKPLRISLDAQSLEVMDFPEFPKDRGLVGGWNYADLLAGSDPFWMKLFPGVEGESFGDYLRFLGSGQTAEKQFFMLNTSDQVHALRVEGRLSQASGRPMIELTLQDRTQDVQRESPSPQAGHGGSLDRVRAVLIDHSFLGENPAATFKAFQDALQKKTGKDIPVVLIGPPPSPRHFAKLITTPSHDLMFKPLDRGVVSRKMKVFVEATEKPDQLARMEEFLDAEGWVDMARPVPAAGIAEYGIHLNLASPVQSGVIVRIYHETVNDPETRRGTLARCYKSEANADKTFRCSFVFLGLSADQLRRIRLFLKMHKEQEAAAPAGSS